MTNVGICNLICLSNLWATGATTLVWPLQALCFLLSRLLLAFTFSPFPAKALATLGPCKYGLLVSHRLGGDTFLAQLDSFLRESSRPLNQRTAVAINQVTQYVRVAAAQKGRQNYENLGSFWSVLHKNSAS